MRWLHGEIGIDQVLGKGLSVVDFEIREATVLHYPGDTLCSPMNYCQLKGRPTSRAGLPRPSFYGKKKEILKFYSVNKILLNSTAVK